MRNSHNEIIKIAVIFVVVSIIGAGLLGGGTGALRGITATGGANMVDCAELLN